jgi:hypothetical protein
MMSPETTHLLNAVIAASAAILGAAVGVIGTIIVTAISRKAEERNHIRSLAVNAGIENFKSLIEVARGSHRTMAFPPLESFIMNMKLAAEILFEDNIKSDWLRDKLREKDELLKVMLEQAKVPYDIKDPGSKS